MTTATVAVVVIRCECGREIATINSAGFSADMFSIKLWCGRCRVYQWVDVVR